MRNYEFLVQIRPFRNPDWESLKTFLKLLVNKLPSLNKADLSKGILESIDMDSYRIERQTTLAIQLAGSVESAPPATDTSGSKYAPNIDVLSNIIQPTFRRYSSRRKGR
ncbi:hypothetical protein [Microcoleus vaginatus]|uniref:hypothetical protein n=1 Tax=Microcoleus vaginatus TaxID=119532 RepID=UPI0032AD0298